MSAPIVPDKPSFTLDEVAELTAFPKRVLQDACREGRIRHQHLGRQRTFTRDQVIELFDRTEVTVGSHQANRELTPHDQRLKASRDRALARLRRRGASAGRGATGTG
jgi:excisionase family DNA binding protein